MMVAMVVIVIAIGAVNVWRVVRVVMVGFKIGRGGLDGIGHVRPHRTVNRSDGGAGSHSPTTEDTCSDKSLERQGHAWKGS